VIAIPVGTYSNHSWFVCKAHLEVQAFRPKPLRVPFFKLRENRMREVAQEFRAAFH